jgi:hypothetical protein
MSPRRCPLPQSTQSSDIEKTKMIAKTAEPLGIASMTIL